MVPTTPLGETTFPTEALDEYNRIVASAQKLLDSGSVVLLNADLGFDRVAELTRQLQQAKRGLEHDRKGIMVNEFAVGQLLGQCQKEIRPILSRLHRIPHMSSSHHQFRVSCLSIAFLLK